MAKKIDFNAKKELAKLQKIVATLPEDKRKLTEGLVVDASFMAEELQKLRTHITEEGWTMPYQNGPNQYGIKVSIEADTYIKLQKQYAVIIKQLADLLPSGGTATPGQAILDFIPKGKT